MGGVGGIKLNQLPLQEVAIVSDVPSEEPAKRFVEFSADRRNIRRDIPPKVKRDDTFTGEDGVPVLDFLAKLVQEFDTQEMNEGQAIRLLPEFLSGMALRQYTCVSQTAGSHHGKSSIWPEAIQWLWRSFDTDEAICLAVLALREVRERPSEDEMEIYIRLTDASNRCRNVHSMALRYLGYGKDGGQARARRSKGRVLRC